MSGVSAIIYARAKELLFVANKGEDEKWSLVILCQVDREEKILLKTNPTYEDLDVLADHLHKYLEAIRSYFTRRPSVHNVMDSENVEEFADLAHFPALLTPTIVDKIVDGIRKRGHASGMPR